MKVDRQDVNTERLLEELETAKARIAVLEEKNQELRDIKNQRKQVEETLRYRAAFERVVTEVSTDFINIPVSEIDGGINRALKMIGEFSGVDRSYVFLYSDEKKLMSNTHEWCASGIESQLHRVQDVPVEALWWINEQILKHETVYVPRLSNLPDDAAEIKEECKAQGIKSFLGVPLISGGDCIGALGFDSVHKEREWTEDNIVTLKLAAYAIADSVVRKQAHEKVQESEEKLRSILESSPFSIAVTDLQGNVTDCNQATLDLHGYESREELLGTSAFNFFHDSEKPIAQLKMEETFRLGVTKNVEYQLARKDGSRFPGEVSASVIRGPDGEPRAFVAIVEDISERKRAGKEKAKLEAQLYQSQKMEAIGQLAGGIAHDFNNLLCGILGNTDLSLKRLRQGDPLRGSLEEVSKAAERAAELTKQLLAFSRKQIIEPKVINLSRLIERLHSMLSRLIGEDILLRTQPEENLGLVRADPTQIEQVVLNLVINARDAMPHGGELLIETANGRLSGEQFEKISDETECTHVLLSVRDTGCGMNDEVRERIFEPFFTTKEPGQGTGLGLSSVFGTVEQNNGQIIVLSEPGQGSTFNICFPRFDGVYETLPPKKTTEPPVGGEETILVVEDDTTVRELTERLLEQLGYNVLSTDSGHKALIVSNNYRDQIDLLFTDVVMPRMNGQELASKIIKIRPQIKVLYTSGYTEDAIVHRAILEKGVQFLAKPFSLETLASRVRQVLDRR